MKSPTMNLFSYGVLLLILLFAEAFENETLYRVRRGRPSTAPNEVVPQSEVKPSEALFELEDLNSRSLSQYIGSLDDATSETAQKGLQFLAKYSLIPNTRTCNTCGGLLSLIRDPSVKHDKVRSGSFFGHLKMTIQQLLFLASEWIESPEKPIRDVATQMKLNPSTVVEAQEWFRRMAQQWFERETSQNTDMILGGPDKYVEIDETLMYKAKYNKGHMLTRPQIWMFGMIERGSSKVMMFRVEKRDAATLLPLIYQYVAPGTNVVSDGWAAYGGISSLQAGFNHDWGHMFQYMWRRFYDKKKLLNRLIYEMKSFRRQVEDEEGQDGDDVDGTSTPPPADAESTTVAPVPVDQDTGTLDPEDEDDGPHVSATNEADGLLRQSGSGSTRGRSRGQGTGAGRARGNARGTNQGHNTVTTTIAPGSAPTNPRGRGRGGNAPTAPRRGRPTTPKPTTTTTSAPSAETTTAPRRSRTTTPKPTTTTTSAPSAETSTAPRRSRTTTPKPATTTTSAPSAETSTAARRSRTTTPKPATTTASAPRTPTTTAPKRGRASSPKPMTTAAHPTTRSKNVKSSSGTAAPTKKPKTKGSDLTATNKGVQAKSSKKKQAETTDIKRRGKA